MQWIGARLQEIYRLSSRKDHLSITVHNISTENYPLLSPHRVEIAILVSYLASRKAQGLEADLRAILKGSKFKTGLEIVSDRPPMQEKKTNLRLADSLGEVAKAWEIPFSVESSLWPSAGGLVSRIPVVCGLGPTPKDLYTPQEGVNRTSLIQRTLLLAEFLLDKK